MFFPCLASRDEDHLNYYIGAKRMLSALCDLHKCPFLEVLPLLESKPYSHWWIKPEDLHPNSEAHGIAAEAIAEKILEKFNKDTPQSE